MQCTPANNDATDAQSSVTSVNEEASVSQDFLEQSEGYPERAALPQQPSSGTRNLFDDQSSPEDNNGGDCM